MKKILLLIAAAGLLMCAISCGNDDEPRRTVFTVNTPMINHMVNTLSGEVLGISNTHNKLTIDTVKHTAMLELNYNDGSDKTLVLNDLTATPNGLYYELKSPSYARFSGYVDFSEGSMRYCYTTDEGIRVISTIADVFFLKTKSTIEYSDTTPTTVWETAMYQFTFVPGSSNAVVKVSDIIHLQENKLFINMTATSVPYTITKDGYSFDCQDVKNTASFRSWTDSLGVPTIKYTDKYPFKIFKASVDLEHDHLDAHFMMGDKATVTATGSTYLDYTAY